MPNKTVFSPVMNRVSRRTCIVQGLGALTLSATGFSGRIVAGDSLNVGLQLFSVDEQLRRDLPGTLRIIRDIGYRDVEAVGFYGRRGDELRSAFEAAGLRCASVHVRPQPFVADMPSLETAAETQLAYCRDLGVRYLVCPGPWLPEHIARTLASTQITKDKFVAAVQGLTSDDWQRSAEWLNTMAARARGYGLQFLYHNTNLEFVRVGDEYAYDLLLRQTDPQLVKLELDCGWALAAGVDPLVYLHTHASRIPLVHLKELQRTPPNTVMQINSTNIGTGIVNWSQMLAALQTASVEHAYLEQEEPLTRPPLESARMNYQYLSKLVR